MVTFAMSPSRNNSDTARHPSKQHAINKHSYRLDKDMNFCYGFFLDVPFNNDYEVRGRVGYTEGRCGKLNGEGPYLEIWHFMADPLSV